VDADRALADWASSAPDAESNPDTNHPSGSNATSINPTASTCALGRGPTDGSHGNNAAVGSSTDSQNGNNATGRSSSGWSKTSEAADGNAIARSSRSGSPTDGGSTGSRWAESGDGHDTTGADERQAPARVIDAPEHLSYGWSADGKFRLSFTGNVDTGARIMQALDEIRDQLFRDSGRSATGGEVMREACGRMLANTSPERADRFRAYVHLDTDGAWLSQGPRIPEWLRRKLTCDGHLTPVWETSGTPVNLGRTVRTFPDHFRRLILDRDRTCRRPGCSNVKGLEAHHVQHWEDGGESSPENGTALCPSDHDAHHRGEFSISGNANLPDGLIFRDRSGRVIPNGPQPKPLTEPPPVARYRHALGEAFNPHWLSLPEPSAHLLHARHPDFDLADLRA
jgi:hypothetical protein